MCTSSTATPAATGGLSLAVRKQRSGRSRLPPAESASPATSCASPGRAATARASPVSTSAMYAATPGVACTAASALISRGLARVEGDDRAREEAEAHVGEARCPQHVREPLRGREALHRRGQVRVRIAAGQHLPEQWDDTVEPERVERPQHAAWLRDLEDREASARPQDAPQLAQRELEVGDVPRAEADCRRVEGLVGERKREHVALHPLDDVV